MSVKKCVDFDPDKVFKNLHVIEFPISIVGLCTKRVLNVGVDLTSSAYVKTMYNGTLMKFEDARKISPSHRAFELVQLDNETIEVIFLPTNECISKSKQNRNYGNRFVCDLRIIQVTGLHCCFDEIHSEISRYYLCGQFGNCELIHGPHKIDFNDIFVNDKHTRVLQIHNSSTILESKLIFEKQPPFEASPREFVIKPNSTIKVTISMQPRNPNVGKSITFRILNPHNFDNIAQKSLVLAIPVRANIKYNMKPNIKVTESLHKLTREIDPDYTYCGKSLIEYRRRQEIAFKHLEVAKATSQKIRSKDVMIRNEQCYVHEYPEAKLRRSFCNPIVDELDILDLFNITISPQCIDFGKVAPATYEVSSINITNATKKKVDINFVPNKAVLYTCKKLHCIALMLQPFSTAKVIIFCLGSILGSHLGTIEYKIAGKYFRQHLYKITVENPSLTLKENIAKLGLVTAEHFVTNVPIKLINEYNVPINFEWEEVDEEKPFYIKPSFGVVMKRSCYICDLIYVTTNTKSKVHELHLTSHNNSSTSAITLEVNIISRKLTIKFTQTSVFIHDMPLNMSVKKTVYLENMSREICLFNVIDPLIPGFCIKPMGGIINPKTIVTFTLSAKFSCILEFSADILVKINNKENVVLSVSGNVLEPKVICYPRNISVPRVPSCMIAYVAVNLKNLCSQPMHIDILDTGDENMFDVCVADGNEKIKINELFLEGGRSKTLFIKIYDDIRREYDFFIPLQVNGILGPANANPHSIEFRRYVEENESLYTNNSKTRVKTMYRDITYCRISGVITMPQVKISQDNFNFIYVSGVTNNALEFTITNTAKDCLTITIVNSKLYPNYSLSVISPQLDSAAPGTLIKFPLHREEVATLVVKFHPREMGMFTATALLYLDHTLAIPYHNLTFTGNFLNNAMKSETSIIIFPPCLTKTSMSKVIILLAEGNCAISSFRYSNDVPEGVTVEFIDVELEEKENSIHTKLKVKISVCFNESNSKRTYVNFYNENGASCSVTVVYCYTTCSLTLHANHFRQFNDTYPYYPSSDDSKFFDYMETCSMFLERWLFQQGFRRDLYPSIPETFHAISSNSEKNPKGINATYQSFIKRIAGPLAKHIGKESSSNGDDDIKVVKETYESYKEIVKLLKSRKADLGFVNPLYLLSYDQFNSYLHQLKSENPYNFIDNFNLNLLSDMELYNRLNKQSWIDFIIQTYKAYVLDSCFFECTCISNLPRDINKILMDFFNDRIRTFDKITKKFNIILKPIENLTTDLQDGVVIIVLILSYCPFLEEHFSKFLTTQEESQKQAVIIHNTCLITEVLLNLKINFPITSEDFLKPNYLQMLFLSVHLYVTLPMLEPKQTIKLTPALQKSSARLLTISPLASDSLVFSFFILKNPSNNFVVEKVSSGNANKKVILSVKYFANFVREETSTLIVYGYNKSRIFDTFVVFILKGQAGFLTPFRKYKIAAPLYKPNKTDIVISSPFTISSNFKITVTEKEPTIPECFINEDSPKFYIRWVNLVKTEIELDAVPNDLRIQDYPEQKLSIEVICLSTQVRHSWLWFRSDIGEFFVKVSSHPRVDVPLDIFHINVPVRDENCSCAECDCENIVSVTISHCNELMVKSMKYALMMNASLDMIHVFERLIETETGRVILSMILEDNNVDINEFNHIFNTSIEYRYNSKNVTSRSGTTFSMDLYSSKVEIIEIEVPDEIDDNEKYTFTLESKCGMDVRTFRIVWETHETESDHASRTKPY